ncbi:MAG: ABC transporter permease [Anaerolineae bacterium]|nr:ABC transporter permease [Anaerolineae bacterium]
MSLMYLVRRVLFLLLVIWVAATITFFIPRLSQKNPIRQRFAELATTGGFSPEKLEEIVASYNRQFGLDKPLMEQYFTYLGQISRGDFGVSLYRYPKTVAELIFEALPWTIGLLLSTTLIAFVLGNLLGAMSAWPRSPHWLKGLMGPLMMLQGIPPYLLGILLIFFVAYRLNVLPQGGAYEQGTAPTFTLRFILDVARHQMLPALSLILASVGFWALGMRGMGVTIQGEDYVNFAEHKGLSPRTIFSSYYIRNALLPQVTGLALAFSGVVVSGGLVEQLYGLPGVGSVLGAAILANDYFVIYGITLALIFAVAIFMLIVDIIYPLLDPRIRY